MATHSRVRTWRISGTGEPGGLPSMGSHRVGHDWNDLAAAAALYRYHNSEEPTPETGQWHLIFLCLGFLRVKWNWHYINPLLKTLLGRKTVTNQDSVLKSWDITLPTKVCIVKAMVFPVVMYGCKSWTIKKAEPRRIDADAFELWCWRRLLRVPWTVRRANQSIPKEINPEYSVEGMMLKVKLHYFGHLMRRASSLGKTLMLGKTQGRRRRGQQRMKWLDSITDSVDVNLNKLTR